MRSKRTKNICINPKVLPFSEYTSRKLSLKKYIPSTLGLFSGDIFCQIFLTGQVCLASLGVWGYNKIGRMVSGKKGRGVSRAGAAAEEQ